MKLHSMGEAQKNHCANPKCIYRNLMKMYTVDSILFAESNELRVAPAISHTQIKYHILCGVLTPEPGSDWRTGEGNNIRLFISPNRRLVQTSEFYLTNSITFNISLFIEQFFFSRSHLFYLFHFYFYFVWLLLGSFYFYCF